METKKRLLIALMLLGIHADAGARAGKTEARTIKLTELKPYQLHTLEGHKYAVLSVAYSPDGKTIASGGGDKTVRRWDAARGNPIGEPLKHDNWVYSVAFSPDGKTIASGSRDKTVRRWDAATGNPIGKPLKHDDGVRSVAFSPDGKTIASGSDDYTVRRWDAASGKPIGLPLWHGGVVFSVAYSPDGKTIATGSILASGIFSGGIVRRWDAASGNPIGEAMKHMHVRSVVFSPDGKPIASGSWDKTVRRWDAATGKPIDEPLKLNFPVYSMAYSPDGKTIASGGDNGTVQRWDAASGKPIGEPVKHGHRLVSVAYSPDGKTIATVGADKIVRIWQTTDTLSRSFVGKRPLENQDEYRARIADARFAYSTERIQLLEYDMVREGFTALFFERVVFIPVSRAEVKKHNILKTFEVRVDCTLRFKPGAYDGNAALPEALEILAPRLVFTSLPDAPAFEIGDRE